MWLCKRGRVSDDRKLRCQEHRLPTRSLFFSDAATKSSVSKRAILQSRSLMAYISSPRTSYAFDGIIINLVLYRMTFTEIVEFILAYRLSDRSSVISVITTSLGHFLRSHYTFHSIKPRSFIKTVLPISQLKWKSHKTTTNITNADCNNLWLPNLQALIRLVSE